MDKENVLYIQNIIQPQEEGSLAICHNVDDLEDIWLTEMNQSEKDEYCIIPPMLSKLLKCIETEGKMVVVTAWG